MNLSSDPFVLRSTSKDAEDQHLFLPCNTPQPPPPPPPPPTPRRYVAAMGGLLAALGVIGGLTAVEGARVGSQLWLQKWTADVDASGGVWRVHPASKPVHPVAQRPLALPAAVCAGSRCGATAAGHWPRPRRAFAHLLNLFGDLPLLSQVPLLTPPSGTWVSTRVSRDARWVPLGPCLWSVSTVCLTSGTQRTEW